MPPALPWILTSIAFALLAGAAVLWAWQRRGPPAAAPSLEGGFAARPVFDSVERRVHRELREALPEHIVLARVPLRRFCRALDPQRARPFAARMAMLDVGFLICSASGRVLAAIDLERSDDAAVAEQRRFKAELLAACRLRYLRCNPDALPTLAELIPAAENTPQARERRPAEGERAPAMPRRRDHHIWVEPPPAPLAETSWVGEVPSAEPAPAAPVPPWVTPTRRASDQRSRAGDGTAHLPPPRRH
ncbi:DUF2726 domain-containing protein [Rubrivivax gelatinosus]|uniref:DUF2726 domain-containing protein n=1 Tax=Rubrivivax gelatinosus TaxID=28068 RepID=A0ABS1DRM9_RUBGE|nr:DUF2726 domain-containing protein [Rubrivivax gelatinosus]MBK1712274.1 hypothetical protein [Rubrivivax gelatinosus]